MTDRELLEAAAKAAGIDYYARAQSGGMLTDNGEWNPLTDDGDALRLAVRLRMMSSRVMSCSFQSQPQP